LKNTFFQQSDSEQFKEQNSATEHRWGLPRSFKADQISAKLDGSTLIITVYFALHVYESIV
jgi:hypothetical protein